MKILFCTNKFNEVTNGPAKFANLLLQINDSYPDHQLKILTEDVVEDQENVYKLNLRYPFFLNLFSQFIRIWAYYKAAKKIKKNQFDFDVIVFNNAFIGLWSAIRFPYSIGMINDYNNASRNWGNLVLKQLAVKQFIFKQAERLSVFVFNKIIVNSDYLKDYLLKIYSAKEEKYFKLYKCIENVDQPKIKSIIPEKQIHVLFVKADFILGGIEELILALDQLSYKFKLTIIGPAEHFFSKIKTFPKHKSLIELNILGSQPQSVVFQYMTNADIFCVPSRKEALGVANLEALARGIPVVTTNVGGIPEILQYGQNGWIVPPFKSDLLATAIEECICNDDLRNTKIQKGIAYSHHFSIEASLERFLNIAEKSF